MFRLFGALAALTALTVLVPTTPLMAQSFNCRYAKTPDEVAICDNSSLAEMDVKVSNLYFGYRNFYHGPARRRLEADQAAWLKTRLDCGRNFICIAKAYKARVDHLYQHNTPEVCDGPILQQPMGCDAGGSSTITDDDVAGVLAGMNR
jgi:uncharacterized protein